MMTNMLAARQTQGNYRWVVLALCALTPMIVLTLPNMSVPPLFATIGDDIGLSLVEMGTIWGVKPFAGIFFAFIGGTLGDRFGSRTTLVFICLTSGLAGISRAFAVDFFTLLLASLALGIFQAIIPVMVFKVARQYFPADQLGMAGGFISLGFASGLLLGPLISTSVMLPALGGWREIFVFYGVLAVIVSVSWLIVLPAEQTTSSSPKPRLPLQDSFRHVIRLRQLWVLGIGGLGLNACFLGFSGYLPTYLKEIGWAELDADRALSLFFVTSLLAVVPLTILSDRLHIRRGFLIIGAVGLSVGIGALSVVEGTMILVTVAATGVMFDALMSISTTTVLEVDGVGGLYAGTALGFVLMIRNLGGAFAPAMGNALAVYGASVPFLFWGGMGVLAVVMYIFAFKPGHAAMQEATATT